MANCFFESNLFVQEDDRVKRCGCELVPPRFNSFGLTCRVWTLRTQDSLSRRTASARLLLSISLIKQVSLSQCSFPTRPVSFKNIFIPMTIASRHCCDARHEKCREQSSCKTSARNRIRRRCRMSNNFNHDVHWVCGECTSCQHIG